MRSHIEKLKLTKFRGGGQPVIFDFAPDKNIVIIFGNNGAGKSSIVDAIDFVCNNEFGSLEDRSGTTPRTHVVSLNGQGEDLAVKIRYGGQDWEAKLQSGKPVTRPANQPRAVVLRRTDIARVMEAAPAERYKALHAYITVANVERAEGELRKAYKAMQDSVDRAEQSRVGAVAALESLWRKEGSPDDSALQWAASKTDVRVDSQRLALEADRRLSEGIGQALSARAALRSAEQSAVAADMALAAARAALQMAAGAQAQEGAALLALLTDARRYLQGMSAAVQTCPVCGQPATAGALLPRVEEQLQRLGELQPLRTTEQSAEQTQMQAQGALRSAQAALISQCRKLAGGTLDASAEYGEAIDVGALSAASDDPPRLAAALSALDGAAGAQAALNTALAETEKTVHLWNALQNHLQTIDEAEHTMRGQAAVAQRLKALLTVVETERKSYVDRLVHAISSDVNAFYARIHPEEPLGGSSLYVKPNVAGSLELRAAFGGAADVVPGAYYSDAHLDTLGLCVYLALAKRSGGSQIVVLDDVLAAVDDAHLDRITDLLIEQAPGLGQVIITTHSSAWFERLRTTKGMPVDLIELGGWDLANGIRYSRAA